MKRLDGLIEYSSIIPGGIFIYKADETEELIYANDEVLKIFGCNSIEEFKELTGNSFKGMVHRGDLKTVESSISSQISDNDDELDYVDYRIVKKNGDIAYIEDFGRLIHTKDGDYYVVFISDVTKKHNREISYKKQLTKELSERKRYDLLTGLYNRDEFIRKIKSQINKVNNAYVLFINVDNYSNFTDIFGIKEGNNLLIHIADAMDFIGQEYDEVLCARLYNDIFTMFVNECSLEDIEEIVEEIKTVTKGFTSKFDITLSVGVYKIEDKTISVEKMIDYAETASETIKQKYEKKFALYSEEMNEKNRRDQYIVNNMERALLNNEFCIYLQPKYNIRTNKIIGAEALVRWIRYGEVISPGEFIPLFEKNGYIAKLDLHVLEETCRYIKNRVDNKMKNIPISVNVSRFFFTMNSFIYDVTSIINKYGIPKDLIEFEITESMFTATNTIKDKVNELRKLGYKINMDDFGSAYSGLNILKDVDFDIMKLDLKFFQSNDKKAQIIIKAVLNMAKELKIPVVAEGVENKEHLMVLRKFGCDYAQGYFYSKPLPKDKFDELLER